MCLRPRPTGRVCWDHTTTSKSKASRPDEGHKKQGVLIICSIAEMVEMLGIDGSDDIHKYAMVSFWAEVAHCCMRKLASERRVTNAFVTPR